MKRLIIIVLAGVIIGGLQVVRAEDSEDKGITKSAYLAKMKKRLEASGKQFDKAKLEASFDQKDANKDGVLTRAEIEAAK